MNPSAQATTEELPLSESAKFATDAIPKEDFRQPHNVRVDALRDELRSGAIPDYLREEMKIIDPLSESGIAFQREMQSLVARVVPEDFDLEERPIRYLLSLSDQPNAMVLADAEPETVVLTAALFSPTLTGAPKTEDAFIGVLFHEGCHLQLRRENTNWNYKQKAEEGLADGVAIERLHRAGYDPRAYLEFLKDSSGVTAAHIASFEHDLKEVLDAHPIHQNRIGLAEALLTKLERGEKELEVESTPIELHRPFQGLIETAHFQSHLSSVLENVDYAQLTSPERLKKLVEYHQVNSNWFRARKEEFCEHIRELVSSHEFSSEEIDLFYEPLLSELEEHCTPQHDISFIGIAINTGKTSRDQAAAFDPIKQRVDFLAASGDQDGKVPVQGKRFELIAEKISRFIEAETDHDRVSSSQELIECLNQEPLMQHWLGRYALRHVDWPRFQYPQKKGEIVDWNDHVLQFHNLNEQGLLEAEVLGRALLECESLDPRLVETLPPELRVYTLETPFMLNDQMGIGRTILTFQGYRLDLLPTIILRLDTGIRGNRYRLSILLTTAMESDLFPRLSPRCGKTAPSSSSRLYKVFM